MDKMQEKSIGWQWYSSRELTRLKTAINRDPNWITSHPLATVISDAASTYGVAPGVLIDHLKIKQDRNYSTHYTQKIRAYAVETKEFLGWQILFRNTPNFKHLVNLKRLYYNLSFFNVCKEILATSETTAE